MKKLNRMTKIKIIVWTSILMFVAGLVLGIYDVIDSLIGGFDILSIILFVVAAVLMIVGIALYAKFSNIKRKACLKCGKPLYGCAYEWVLTQLYNKFARDNSVSYQVAAYDIKAICPHCEKEINFHQEFIATDYATGAQYNTQKLIEDWCKEKFGH